jgi:restriction endonuclease Mrr
MTTYREPDGVDFWAIDIKTQEPVYVWVRRWKKTKVGEIPLRNFAQAINDLKAKGGLFVTTTGLTEGAEGSLQQLNKVRVVGPDELDQYLKGLL